MPTARGAWIACETRFAASSAGGSGIAPPAKYSFWTSMTTSASATEGVYDLRPPELVEPILVDAEVVRELVENRDPDLVLQDGRVGAEFLLERQAIDGDLVGQGARV